MSYKHLSLSFFIILCFSSNGCVNNEMPNKLQQIPLIEAVLDFSKEFDEGNDREADKFMSALGTNTGNVIKLKLKIIPDQRKDSFNYSLITDQKLPTPDSDDLKIKCGQGTYGIVDNYSYNLTVSFHHTANYHNPTTIYLGNRAEFPKISVICGSGNHIENTPLYITGHFVVDSAEIPTAIEKVLFPYNN